MSVRSSFVAVLCAASLGAVGAGTALAGEVTGNGDPTAAPSHTASICAFSGRNDANPPPGRTAAHVQNWGQITKAERDFLRTIGFHPGDSCNGATGFLSGGGGE